jgi:hypothetical protein
MALRSTLGPPSTFEGEVAGLEVTGEYEGKGWHVSVAAGKEAVTLKVVGGSGRVTVKIKKRAEDGPAILPFLMPTPKPYNGNGKANGPEKRTFNLNEKGEIEYTTLDYLTEEEFEKETAGPSEPIVPVNNRKLPLGVCVEYKNRGKIVRTEWSKRGETRRAA